MLQNDTNEIQLTVNGDQTQITELQSSVNVPEIGFDTIILDCSTWSFIDSMGVKALTSVRISDV
jgi:anti-anti-sigma regulatory factor